jgi:hypothetical protein
VHFFPVTLAVPNMMAEMSKVLSKRQQPSNILDTPRSTSSAAVPKPKPMLSPVRNEESLAECSSPSGEQPSLACDAEKV